MGAFPVSSKFQASLDRSPTSPTPFSPEGNPHKSPPFNEKLGFNIPSAWRPWRRNPELPGNPHRQVGVCTRSKSRSETESKEGKKEVNNKTTRAKGLGHAARLAPAWKKLQNKRETSWQFVSRQTMISIRKDAHSSEGHGFEFKK